MVRFQIGEVEVQAEFNDSQTARKILEAMPFKAEGNYWGGEIYFEVPVHCAYEKDAREVVDPGTVAFWPATACASSGVPLRPAVGRSAALPAK